jgi:hypothetical protein
VGSELQRANIGAGVCILDMSASAAVGPFQRASTGSTPFVPAAAADFVEGHASEFVCAAAELPGRSCCLFPVPRLLVARRAPSITAVGEICPAGYLLVETSQRTPSLSCKVKP